MYRFESLAAASKVLRIEVPRVCHRTPGVSISSSFLEEVVGIPQA